MFGIKVEKDPTIDSLTANVLGQMQDIVQQECSIIEINNPNEIKFVSFEDALKELVSLKNS